MMGYFLFNMIFLYVIFLINAVVGCLMFHSIYGIIISMRIPHEKSVISSIFMHSKSGYFIHRPLNYS
jgi:isoprenylcysteine carboxyl methyltransferase (ICMT) family protein YpbQ